MGHNGTVYEETGDEYRNFERILKILLPIVLGVITLLGVLGNGLVIWTILTNKKMKTPTNLLILNLAVADFLFVVMCVPFYVVEYMSPKYMYGSAGCKISRYLIYVCACVSIYTLVLMSLVRCIVVVHPLSSKSWITTCRVCITVAAIWIITLGGFSPLLVQYEIYSYSHFGEAKSACVDLKALLFPNLQKLVSLMFFVFGYALPLYIMIILYGILLIMLRCGSRSTGSLEFSRQRHRAHGHATKMVIVVVVCFLLCWLPLQVIFMVLAFGKWPGTVAGTVVNMLANCLAYFNSCMNPILYAFLSTQFRQRFKQALCCGRRSTAEQ